MLFECFIGCVVCDSMSEELLCYVTLVYPPLSPQPPPPSPQSVVTPLCCYVIPHVQCCPVALVCCSHWVVLVEEGPRC